MLCKTIYFASVETITVYDAISKYSSADIIISVYKNIKDKKYLL